MKGSSPSLRHSVYSYRFAANVVESFVDKYGRATIFVGRKLCMEPRAFKMGLIKMFMNHNMHFQIFREVIKRVEKYNMYSDFSHLSRSDFILYLTSVKVWVEDDYMDGLFCAK